MLAWIDLEMTGLDPSRHVIVEIASLITDDDLEIIAEGPDLVVNATDEELAEMDDFVTSMHRTSGLDLEITSSTLTMADAEAATLAFLREHIAEAGTVPLAGNSIGTDRRFLASQMPSIEDFLHYRSIDVSTIKELCRRWYPEHAAAAPPKQGAHRALGDIKESVAELAYYRSAIFIPQTKERP
jgi:oligoribonuclease